MTRKNDLSSGRINPGSAKSSAMQLVINQLMVRPHTSASLVQSIGVYSAAHINRCLRTLKAAGRIGAVRDAKQKALVYYKINLGKDDQPASD